MLARRTLIFPAVILCQLGLVIAPAAAETRRLRSPVEVTIRLEKELYRQFEPVTGEVIIFNSRPATFPINFTVELYRNGEFYRRSIVNTPVFSGSNELGLDTFAKDVFDDPHAVARWRMVITTGGDLPAGDTAEFEIVAADYQEPRKRGKYLYSTSPPEPPSKPPQKRGLDFRNDR